MNKYLVLFLVGLALLLSFGFILKSGKGSSGISKNSAQRTEVIKYNQSSVPKETQSGYCWTDSIAAFANDKAWRCATNSNSIFDPCFETTTGQVVCGIDPEDPNSGFELKLTKALPKMERVGEKYGERFWRFNLSNGFICEALTGTTGTIAGESYSYACDNNTVLIDNYDQTNPLWQARVVYLSDNQSEINKSERLNITKAWK